MISEDKVLEISEIAKLSLSKEELKDYTEGLNKMIEFIESVEGIEAEDIHPTYQLDLKGHPLRKDIVKEGLSRKEVLRNTLEEQYGHFKIINVMD